MEREEPKIGDMSQIEFRPRSYRGPTRPQLSSRSNNNDMVWKIAIGVFIGLCLFGMVTCTGMAIVGSAVQAEQEKQVKAALQQVENAMKPLRVETQQVKNEWQRTEIERQRRAAQERALGPGERCIGGKRFRRVDNGWVQIQKPC